MMGTAEGLLSVVTVDSVAEDVLNSHAMRLSLDRDLVSRREEEAASRRYEAASWLRRTVGVVAARDLPEEPSEEEFRLGLRNGIILCNALNKLHPGTIPKVVEAPSDFTPPPDGAALCAYQYFENLRNFLVALEDLHLPTFEASDLEKGGKAARVVNSILALKSHSERRGKSQWTRLNSSFASLNNGNGTSTCSSSSSTKYFVRKNSEPFMNSIFRSQSSEALSVEQNLSLDVSIESSQMTASHSLHMLVSTMLSGKKPEEVPELVGSIISRVVEEFENRMSTQNKTVAETMDEFKSDVQPNEIPLPASSKEAKIEKVEISKESDNNTEAPKEKEVAANLNIQVPKEKELAANLNVQALKEKQIATNLNVDRQKRKIQELREMLCTVKSGMENMRLQYHDEFINLGKHLGKLSHAASGYRKVLEENRKLYNIVQDLKGNIRVYCRVRPLKSSIPTSVASIGDDQITILTPSNYGKEGRKSFKFNKVFGPSATQEEVFSDMRPLIRSVLDGYNVCIFAYGQTGSGKTHTMTGPNDLTEETQGVNFRALNDLFYMTETRRDTFSYDISVQMIEIYNEQVRDLLVDSGGGNNKRLEIRSSSQKGGLAVPGANIVPVYSTLDVIELMNTGSRNRAVSSTAMNDRSSRSHSCLTVHVQGRDLTSGVVLRGSMHLVDLAGSERVDKSEAKGERLKEAQHINKSLSALGDVISSLAQKNSHVPYRNSKLTQLLQGSLGGQAKTLMFVHISPEFDAIGESLSTLKFAERVASVELGAARVNKDNSEVKELREQLANLKAQLAMKDTGESDRLRSPDVYRTKSCTVPSTQLNIRQPMEEVGNIEMRSNLPASQRRLNKLDQCETTSETDSASWIDKTIIENNNSNDENINTTNCAAASLSSSPVPNYYQRYTSDTGVAYPDVDCATVTQSEPGGSDDYSDELELGTSYCSSEHDMVMSWHSELAKVPSLGNGNGGSNNNIIGTPSRLKKPQAKLVATSPDIRSTSHAYKPSPSRTTKPSLTPGKIGNVKRSVSGRVGNGK